MVLSVIIGVDIYGGTLFEAESIDASHWPSTSFISLTY